MINKPTLISVCIASYKREALLKKLLDSLLLQQLPEFVSLEIIVVDNDAEGSAKKVFDTFSDSEKIQFKYFIQPERNISLARNMSVKNASGKYICFIDDDEIADKKWINNLVSYLYKFNVDGVFGYVKPIFDENIPEYLRHRNFYFSQVDESDTAAGFFYTTNTIIRTSLLQNEDMPFNPDYGLTGGEDAHLFERLNRMGAKYIYCKEAVTYEFIPKERGTIKYIYKRAYQGGQSFIRRQLEYNEGFIYKLLIIIKVSIIICLSIISLVFLFFQKVLECIA